MSRVQPSPSPGTTAPRRLPAAPGPAVQALLVVTVLVLGELPLAWHYLVSWPGDQWQVDLEVYREAARSLLYGRPVYQTLTESPQLLPFTYPPFSAIVSLPLALVPFHLLGWVWTALQVAATYATVVIALRALLVRVGGWRHVAAAVLTVPLLYLLPVSDGVRFGQVNAFLVLACLADLALRPGRMHRRQGVWIGLATAIKLTPGVFWVHFAFCRRWRELLHAAAAAAAATLLAALVVPGASVAFWGGALTDPERLGPNRGTSNQSLRGVLLRLGPDGTAGTAVWLACVAVVAVVGFTVARRAWRAGDPVAETAAVGLMAVLLSPVAWIHHFAWMVVVIGAVVGDGRVRARLSGAALLLAWFLCRLPWWGSSWLSGGGAAWFGRLLQNADLLGALIALAMLWRWVPRADDRVDDRAAPAGSAAREDDAAAQPPKSWVQ